MATAEREHASYLGFSLEITDRDVTILDRRGRRLATVASISTARNFCRGYRRIPANTEATGTPAKSAPVASDKGDPTCV